MTITPPNLIIRPHIWVDFWFSFADMQAYRMLHSSLSPKTTMLTMNRTFFYCCLIMSALIFSSCNTTPQDQGEMIFEDESTDEILATVYPSMNLDLVNFSRNGAWMIVKKRDPKNSHRLFVKTLRSRAISHKWMDNWASDYYEFVLEKDGKEIVYETTRYPDRLELSDENQVLATIRFMDWQTMYFTSEVDFIIKPLQNFYWTSRPAKDELLILPKSAKIFHHFKTATNTTLTVMDKEDDDVHSHDIVGIKATAKDGALSFAFREEIDEKKWLDPLPSSQVVHEEVNDQLSDWMEKMPKVPNDLKETAQTAWYLMHHFQVAPSGLITRPTLFCSKNSWLTKIWAWDHCFHGMALALGDYDLGWDQILVMFDNQMSNGALPDPLSDIMGERGFTKPPVHGWTIKRLMEIGGIERSMPYLREVYEPLTRFTEYWYNYHDLNDNGMCAYRHGNDGGWDNATVYDQGNPTEGADLAAYLVIQQEVLAEIAGLLGKPKEAKEWKKRAEKQFQALLLKNVKNNRFVSPLEETGLAMPSQSLINYMPLMLGNRLPSEIRTTMIEDLRPDGNYLTAYGLASEAVNSAKYEMDGYWRGPIWAPPNYQLFDAMLSLGEVELAREIANRYTNMIKRDPGIWENYDALNGTGLQAPGVSWTPAAFMLMANWLAENPV